MNKIYENLDLKDLDGEVWKVIEDFPDYQVSNFGRIKSLKFKKEKILKQWKDNKNYLFIKLWKNNKHTTKKIHSIVYKTFKEKLKENYDVHHKDEDKENNTVINLEPKGHSGHARNHKIGKNNPMFGTDRHGEKSGHHILITQDVFQIKLLLKNKKLTQQEIADIFEVSMKMISLIKLGKRWDHIKI